MTEMEMEWYVAHPFVPEGWVVRLAHRGGRQVVIATSPTSEVQWAVGDPTAVLLTTGQESIADVGFVACDPIIAETLRLWRGGLRQDSI